MGFIKPCKEWDFNYISLNWLASSDFWSINSIPLRNLQQDPLNGPLNLSILIVALATYLRGPLGFGPIQSSWNLVDPKAPWPTVIRQPWCQNSSRWWQLEYLLFSPRKFGEDEPNLTVAYFSKGVKPPTSLPGLGWRSGNASAFAKVLGLHEEVRLFRRGRSAWSWLGSNTAGWLVGWLLGWLLFLVAWLVGWLVFVSFNIRENKSKQSSKKGPVSVW